MQKTRMTGCSEQQRNCEATRLLLEAQPESSVAFEQLQTYSLVLLQQMSVAAMASVEMTTLPQNTSWFCPRRKLEEGLCGVDAEAGRDRASKMGKRRYLVKLSKMSWKVLQKAASVYMMMRQGTVSSPPTHMNRQISTISRSEHLASRTMQSMSSRFSTEKLAAQLESQLRMPIPMFASLIASRSLAPSPTIATFSSSLRHIRYSHPSCCRLPAISSRSLPTISALFSGETREYTRIIGLSRSPSRSLKKSLSTTIGLELDRYSQQESTALLTTTSSRSKWKTFALNLMSAECLPRSELLPYRTTTSSFRSRMPQRTAVSMAMQTLSPVIMRDLMPASSRRWMVSRASCLSLFSNDTSPSILICERCSSLLARMCSPSLNGSTYLQPQPMVRNPLQDSVCSSRSKQANLAVENLCITSGAPFAKTQYLLLCVSQASTDIDWNLDSYWQIFRICRRLGVACCSTSKQVAASLEGQRLKPECRNNLRSISSPISLPSNSFTVWQQAKSLKSRLCPCDCGPISSKARSANLSTLRTCTLSSVRVPVLSKQTRARCAPSTVFSGSVPRTLLALRRTSAKEQTRLKQMGPEGGKQKVMMRRKSRKMMMGSSWPELTRSDIVPRQASTPAAYTSNMNTMKVVKKCGDSGLRCRIFLRIRPFFELQPVRTTIASGLLAERILEPSQIHWLLLPCWQFLCSPTPNLPMGMLSPVRLASLTQSSPFSSNTSQDSSSLGMKMSPGTSSLLGSSRKAPSLSTERVRTTSAICLILRQETQRMTQLMEVVTMDAPISSTDSSGIFSITQMTAAMYCTKKKGSVITSYRYQKQAGGSTMCSFLPNSAAPLSAASEERPCAMKCQLKWSRRQGSRSKPTGQHLPSKYSYFSFLQQKKISVPARSSLTISSWRLPLALMKTCVAASYIGLLRQKTAARRPLQYLSSSSPTTDTSSRLKRRMLFAQENSRKEKLSILHSPQSYSRCFRHSAEQGSDSWFSEARSASIARIIQYSSGQCSLLSCCIFVAAASRWELYAPL